MGKNWPTGTVTFLFSDIESSTPLWDRHRTGMQPALAEHDQILQSAVTANDGVIVKTTGDGAMAAFASPSAALTASLDAQRALLDTRWPTIDPDKIRARMGLHTGEAQLRAGDYFGTAVNRAARIMAGGHGGQILISGTTSALLRGGLPREINLLDLGEHRLKGLNRPAHIYQVQAAGLPREFPPLITGESQKGNLPQPLTSFVGREKELASVEHLLGETRLLTLTGPGGTGKTRLSIEVGHLVEESYDHGVWLAELAPLTDGALVPTAVAALFELREDGGMPIIDVLTDYLRGKKLLLILDNCEHLVSACARLANDMLPTTPGLTILASSREGLGVAGETTMHIPVMGIPTRDMVDRDQVARFEAVRLFVARARAAKPGFELTAANAQAVSQIVRRLDGIPLAIELAAARIKLLSPAQIAVRIDDRFHLLTGGSRTALPRQQTLRALIDWSYDLLEESERWFLRQMSVFVGGWTMEAAEFIVEISNLQDLPGFGQNIPESSELRDLGGLSQLDALDLLANLVNKSLVRIDDSGDEVRYFYLETIRQYARDRLYEAGEGQQARDRHFTYFLQLAGEDFKYGTLTTFDNMERLTRLEIELDNLRAALEWGAGHNPVAAIDLLLYLTALWSTLSLGEEARRRAEMLLDSLAALPPADEKAMPKRRLARAYGLCVFALGAGTTAAGEVAYEALEEAVTILHKDESQSFMLATALYLQSAIGVEIDRPQGEKSAQKAYEIGRTHDYRDIQNLALNAMARWAMIRGDIETAAAYLAEARQIRIDLSMPILIMAQAYVESMVDRVTGDLDGALQILKEGAEALRRTRHRHFANVLDSEMAHTLRQSGDLSAALEIYRRTILVWQDVGRRGAVANQLECFAFIANAEEQSDRAARLFGAAEALRETLDDKMMPEEKKEYDAHVAALQQGMDAGALKAAWRAGRGMDLDTAVAFALNS
jgi:predicted ATPase/class 3 adenylate cyclase